MFVQQSNLTRWAGTNLNTTSFDSKIPTITMPTASATAAVLDLNDQRATGALTPKWLKLFFLLLGADNDAASFRLIGWNRAVKSGSTDLWMPQPFAEFACTGSACVGVAGAAVLNTERFADTIAPVALKIEDIKIAAGTSLMSDAYVYTPADDTAGHVVISTRGFELLEFSLDQTTNTPTGNILYSFLREKGD